MSQKCLKHSISWLKHKLTCKPSWKRVPYPCPTCWLPYLTHCLVSFFCLWAVLQIFKCLGHFGWSHCIFIQLWDFLFNSLLCVLIWNVCTFLCRSSVTNLNGGNNVTERGSYLKVWLRRTYPTGTVPVVLQESNFHQHEHKRASCDLERPLECPASSPSG